MSTTSPAPRTEQRSGAAADYQVIGGAETVRDVVDRLYAAVLGDPELAGYFGGVDIARLKRHQALLLTRLLGGPNGYDGRDLTTAHAGLWISDAHFARVGGHLLAALSAAGAPERVLTAISATLASVRTSVVTAPAPEG